jgi:tetratricopeptide (TPR) repeat protein
MNRLRAPLLSLLLFAAAIGMPVFVHADELKEISQLVGQGQQAQALEKVNAYLASKPKDVAAQFLKGVILAEQNKTAEAIKIFSGITEKHPELPEPYNNLAVLYAEQGQYDKARQALEKAIKTHPSYATAHENLGDIYAKMASDAYDKALQLDRSNARAQTKLSMVKELFSGSSNIAGGTPAKSQPTTKVAVAAPIQATPEPKAAEPRAPESKPAESRPVETKPAEARPAEAKPAPAVAAKEAEKTADKPMDKAKPEPKPESAKTEPKPEAKSDREQDVLDAVQGWAQAWSDRNVDRYLDYYANDFKTPNDEPRSAWEQTRRERIRKPASIEVEVLNPKVNLDGKRAVVEFKQSYRAGGNRMRTSKTLHLRKSGDKWLITQELAKN